MKNQTTNALVDVDKQTPVKPKRTREKIQLIEVQPDERWFQQALDRHGRPIWFLRLQMTGLRTRRYGPFPSQHKALLFLNSLLSEITDGLCDAEANISNYQIKTSRFTFRSGHYPIVEDEVIEASTAKLELSQTAVEKKGW
jgi:hypothetical protein